MKENERDFILIVCVAIVAIVGIVAILRVSEERNFSPVFGMNDIRENLSPEDEKCEIYTTLAQGWYAKGMAQADNATKAIYIRQAQKYDIMARNICGIEQKI